jgi:excisionase family DNA binding protein
MPKNKSPKPSGEYLTIDQVAVELHLSTKSIRRRINHGEFCPFVRIGRRVLWVRSQLMEWMISRQSPTGIPVQHRTRRRAA